MSYCDCSTNTTSKSPCITIRQGDDTAFMNRKITITVNTLADWTGFSAKFKLATVIKTFADVSSKTFELTFTKEDTMKFPVGNQEGWIKFYDASGNSDTISIPVRFNILPIKVKN